MAIWVEAPFVKVVAPFITGILVQQYTQNPPAVSFIVFVLSALVVVASNFLPVRLLFSMSHLQAVAVNLLLISTASLLYFFHDPFLKKVRVAALTERNSVFVVSLREPAAEKKASWKSPASVSIISNAGRCNVVDCGILVYFKKKAKTAVPACGTRIVFRKKLQPILNPTSDSRFNYAEYCARRNIHYQVFLSPGEYVVLAGNDMGKLKSSILAIQDWTIAHLKRYIVGKAECGLALALLIGYKNDVDREIMNAYSNTGVVHVVAISGLHLGIIYMLLTLCCKKMQTTHGGRFFSCVLVIGGLWLFTLLAGAGPSVVRSAVMFTTICTGQLAARRTSLVNNLAASAFMLLAFDPLWLWDLGFLLSYSALLSLVMFSKAISGIVRFKYKAPDELWKLVAATIAAQILTFPLLLYHFGQFPNLFLPANLVAVPVSTFILLAEILLCTVVFSEALSTFVGEVVTLTIRMLNGFITWTDNLAFSRTTGIDVGVAETITIYVIVVLLYGWLIGHEKRCLMPALVLIAILLGTGIVKNMAIKVI